MKTIADSFISETDLSPEPEDSEEVQKEQDKQNLDIIESYLEKLSPSAKIAATVIFAKATGKLFKVKLSIKDKPEKEIYSENIEVVLSPQRSLRDYLGSK